MDTRVQENNVSFLGTEAYLGHCQTCLYDEVFLQKEQLIIDS